MNQKRSIGLITVEQLRAARGLLGWSQSDLASRAGVSLPTVRRAEGGFGTRVSTAASLKLQKALEEAGIEFVEENGGGAGVRFFRARPLHEVGQQSATSDQLKASKTRDAVKILKVSIRQIKAARVLLDWPQDRLARAAGLSVPTIKRLEAQEGPLRGRSETGYKIAAALEKAGIEFIDENGGGPGVRLRKSPKKRM